MPLVPVPELRRKLALLRTYSARTRWDLLAEPFGASPKTVKYWGHGSETRGPDQIPPEALPVLLRLFAELLPADSGDGAVRALVFGPADQLEAALRSGAAASFAALIAREAQTGTAILFRKRDESALIEVEDEQVRHGLPHLTLGELFRIAYPMRAGCRHAATIQGVQRAWAAVPSVITEQSPRLVLLPGQGADRKPRFMRERRDAGLHRFVCLQAAVPFPVLVEVHLRESILFDKQALDALAGFYSRLPEAQRACHILTVAIEADAPP